MADVDAAWILGLADRRCGERRYSANRIAVLYSHNDRTWAACRVLDRGPDNAAANDFARQRAAGDLSRNASFCNREQTLFDSG